MRRGLLVAAALVGLGSAPLSVYAQGGPSYGGPGGPSSYGGSSYGLGRGRVAVERMRVVLPLSQLFGQLAATEGQLAASVTAPIELADVERRVLEALRALVDLPPLQPGTPPLVAVEREEIGRRLAWIHQGLDSLERAAAANGRPVSLLAARQRLDEVMRNVAQAPLVGIQPPVVVEPPVAPRLQPIAPGDLARLLDAIRHAGFSDEKLRVVELGARSSWFQDEQLGRIIDELPFSADKIRALEIVAPRLLDREHDALLLEHFPFSQDRAAAASILERTPPPRVRVR